MPVVTEGDQVRFVREEQDQYLLRRKRKVPGVGPDVPTLRIAFLAEAPGKDEEAYGEAQGYEFGHPLVGNAGSFLAGYCNPAGIHFSGTYRFNVIDRRPDGNDISSAAAQEAIKAQKQQLWEELRWLHSRGCQVIVALGNTAKNALGIPGAISKVRGSVYELNLDWQGIVTDHSAEPCHMLVVPTQHPASFLHQRFAKRRDVKTDDIQIWIEDLKKAKHIADHGYERPREDFIINPSRDQVIEFLGDAVAHKKLLAVDIESTSLTPGRGDVICIGFGISGEQALCVPFFKTGDQVRRRTRYWNENDEELVSRAIEEAFASCPLMFQNSTFDVDYLQQAGWKISAKNVRHDTLLLHHAINSELPHRLGFIVSLYGATPYWKEDFLTRDTSIWELDSVSLQTYNCRDCIVLHQVLQPLRDDMEELGTELAYQESLEMIGPVIEMQQTGLKLSTSRLAAWKKQLEEKIAVTEAELREIMQLPAAFSFSDADVRLLLFGYQIKKHQQAADYSKHREGTQIYAEKKAIWDMIQAIRPLDDLVRASRTTKSGAPSVDKKGRVSLQIKLQNRIATIDALKKPTSEHYEERTRLQQATHWLGHYNSYKELQKLLSTYTAFPVAADGRVHTQYLITGTATGRLASRSPNLQNIPKKGEGAEARAMFVAPAGYSIVTLDYDNLEFRTMAYESGEPAMLAIIEQGLNQHDVNTRNMFGIDKGDSNWDICRRAAKTFQFGTQYGGGDHEVYENIIIDVPEMNLTFARFKEIKQAYMKANPVYAAWKEKIFAEVAKTRKISNAFGRVRILYGPEKDIGKEAINFPGQSSAAHIINGATYRIWLRLHAEDYASRLQAQTHDQLYFECPNVEVPRLVAMATEEMTRPVEFRDKLVSFPVNVEVGPNWKELYGYEGN